MQITNLGDALSLKKHEAMRAPGQTWLQKKQIKLTL